MTKYSGSCHCGAVAYDVEFELGTVLACNCSMCSRSGTLLAFVPTTAFTLTSGEDRLTNYKFNTHNIHHVFCSTCGIKSFARGQKPDGTKLIAINVRCLEGVDADKLDVKHVDGRSR
jgi:hypothetical protein